MFRPSRRQGLVSICMSLLFCVASQAAGRSIEWSHNLKQAAQSAARHNKPLLIKVSTTWCGPCKRMARETFSDERIANRVTQCFVPVALDGDRDSALVSSMGVSSYPTTLVMSSELKVVKRIKGYRSPSQLAEDLGGLCHQSHETNDRATPMVLEAAGRAASPLGQWCPVSPIVDGEFVKGQATVSTVFRGYEVWFRDDRYRQQFLADPHRYWPVGDGHCVVSWFDEQVSRLGSMSFGLEHQGAIWFFASEAHRNRFAANPAKYLQRLAGSRPL